MKNRDEQHPCTCETDGWCTVCREAAGEEIQPYRTPVHCHWCYQDLTYVTQHTLGDYKARRKVCGVNCPKRPATDRTYKVKYYHEMEVTLKASSASAAERTIRKQLKAAGKKGLSVFSAEEV